MERNYSHVPLAKKLGLKPDRTVVAIHPPRPYKSIIAPIPKGVLVGSRVTASTDIVHLFVTTKKELSEQVERLRKLLTDEAVLWVSWPKKSSGKKTDITEHTIRDVALPLGWVDVKVCAIDDTWTGLKLVVRKQLRK